MRIFNKQNLFSGLKSGITILISVLIIFTVVRAGNITPPSGGSEPVAKFYTISEIYTRLTTNAAATEATHDFTFSDSLAGTGRTLTEIYNAIPAIVANTVKLGTTYLGVAGTLIPSGGDAAPANVLSGKTFYGGSQTDWTLQTGVMADNGGFGLACGVSDQAVTAGYYSGGTLAGDADLVAGNIKSGAFDIFGVSGTLLTNPLYGDNDPTKVLNTAANRGTYDVATCTTNYNTLNLSVGTVKKDITFGNGLIGDYPSATYTLPGDTAATDAAAGNILSGLEAWTKAGSLLTGTMADKEGDNGSTAQSAAAGVNYFTAPTGFYDGDDRVSATDTQIAALDIDIAPGNIKSGATIFGIDGNGNVVDTSAGTVTDNAQIRSNYVCFSDGTQYTGSISDCSSEGSQSCYATGAYYAGTSKTPSNSATSQSAGYYSAFDLATVDTDLTASNIGANANIFGVAGTLLKNLYNGSAGDLVLDYAFYTQAKGGVDDYNNNKTSGGLGVMPAGAYASAWTDCTSSPYCGADSNADKKDNSTNLVWSKWLDTGTAHTWFWANNCYEPGTTENPGTCVNSGDDACQCVKKTSSLVGCEALGGGWRLPYQKELMQAYINGSWGNLSSAGSNYWSATTKSDYTQYAWNTYLNFGNTNNSTKTNTIRVRCVR